MPRTGQARAGLAVAVVGAVAIAAGALTLLSWTISEARFDRPSARFDSLATEIAAAPGVTEVQSERWVEAPTFSNPTSWMQVTAAATALTGVIAIACDASYPDAVSWAIDLTTASGTHVSTSAGADHGCPEFGFDPPPVVTELDRVLPGSTIHAAAWDTERLVLSSFEGAGSESISGLLPLVENADSLRAVANIDPATVVEVSAPLLSVEVRPNESAGYHTLLTRLVEDYGVTGFFSGGGGTPIDGID